MNRKGATFFVVFMYAILFFFLGWAFAVPITSAVIGSQQSLGCAVHGINASLNYIQNATCTMIDTYAPLFVGFVLGIGGAIIVAAKG